MKKERGSSRSNSAAPHAQGVSTEPGAEGGFVWGGRRVVVAVAGGIACYKSAALVSLLAQTGAQVRVVMTEAATRFVTPLTFQSLSSHPVMTDIWGAGEEGAGLESPHIVLARWCELMIIAPATADILAKLAAGICDDPVSLVAASLPAKTPVLLAPAMNSDLWDRPTTQRNLATLQRDLGYRIVGPEVGWQACRTMGPGRMSEPERIAAEARKLLDAKARPNG